MRWSAPVSSRRRVAERLLDVTAADRLRAAAAVRVAYPAYLPDDEQGRDDDAELAGSR